MSSETKFVDSLIKNIKLSIHTMAPCRVLKYYESTKEADLEVLFMSKDKDGDLSKYAPVERAPVLRHVGILQRDNIVLVGFAERALDNLRNAPFDPDDRRMHSVKDAVVLGVWQ